MMRNRSFVSVSCVAFVASAALFISAGQSRLIAQDSADATAEKSLNVLFIGNSYTARHNLADVVRTLAEEGYPGLSFNPSTVIYGGRTLADHWRLGTQNIVKRHSLTPSEQEATIASLQQALLMNPNDGHAKNALARHRKLLGELEAERTKWDVVVLQSYCDDLEGAASLYAEYAPKFARLAKAQGARVILYVTTPTTQNAEPLNTPPDAALVMKKAREIAELANRIDAAVAPMSLAGLRCQTQRPDLTLRFINDAHLNQTMAYLTACTLYSAIFNRSPAGLSVDSVTDIRFLDNDRANRNKDRDGNSITRRFNDKDRSDLQRMAWESHVEFQKIRGKQ